ncbi:MAG: hypothetical protein AAGB06_06675, partial [Verrucomicrobiota bacterium]
LHPRNLFLLGALSWVLFGCQSTDTSGLPRVYLESRMGNMRDLETVEIKSSQGSVEIPVAKAPILVETDIARVDLVQVELGKALAFTLRTRGQLRLLQGSAGNLGSRMVVTVGGEPIGVRRIDRPIQNGILYVFAMVPDSELPALVERINEALKSLG